MDRQIKKTYGKGETLNCPLPSSITIRQIILAVTITLIAVLSLIPVFKFDGLFTSDVNISLANPVVNEDYMNVLEYLIDGDIAEVLKVLFVIVSIVYFLGLVLGVIISLLPIFKNTLPNYLQLLPFAIIPLIYISVLFILNLIAVIDLNDGFSDRYFSIDFTFGGIVLLFSSIIAIILMCIWNKEMKKSVSSEGEVQ